MTNKRKGHGNCLFFNDKTNNTIQGPMVEFHIIYIFIFLEFEEEHFLVLGNFFAFSGEIVKD